MNKFLKMSMLAAIAGFIFVGCGTANIYNVQKQPVSIKNETSDYDMYKAIQKAGASKGWIVTKQSDGVAHAQINLRTHQAIVEIKYDNSGYSINYVSSINLNSDGTVIHTNYNGWIQNLQQGINVELSLLTD